MQQAIFMSDPSMAAGNIASAQADAMRTAAGNENGAMMGFMGMGMAAQASGLNAGNLFQMGQQQQQAQAAAQQPQQPQAAAQQPQQPQQAPAGGSCIISSRKLDLQVRDNSHRQILSGMRQP